MGQTRSVRRTSVALSALVISLLALLGVVAFAARPGLAHSDFSGSEPPDGAELEEPLEFVTLTFALEVADPGNGVVASAPDGTVTLADLSTSDDLTWTARFAPSLTGGAHEVRYAMRALDGHMVEGSITLTVTAAAPTTTTSNVTSVSLPSAITTDESATSAPTVATTQPEQGSLIDVAESVVVGRPRWVDPVDHTARLVGDLFSLLVVGMLVFAVVLWRVPAVLPAPRLTLAMALTIAIAGAVELITIAQRLGVSVGEVLGDPLARSPLMTTLGGALIAIGAVAVMTDQVQAPPRLFAWVMALPVVAVIAAPAFDGHAITLGPRWAHLAADVVHVTATSIWMGTVVGLIAVAVNDRRALPVVATRAARWLVVTVVAVVITGLAMTLMIVDGPGDLFNSQWGRRLLVKVAAVIAAGLIGAHHHWRVVPNLRSNGSTRQFRQSLVVEALLLVTVVVVTSWLVVAMP